MHTQVQAELITHLQHASAVTCACSALDSRVYVWKNSSRTCSMRSAATRACSAPSARARSAAASQSRACSCPRSCCAAASPASCGNQALQQTQLCTIWSLNHCQSRRISTQ